MKQDSCAEPCKEIKQISSLPGKKWKCIKIYTGEVCADKILVENIAPFANKLLKEKLIKSWFFIRYTDPDFHLRLRFQLTNNFESEQITLKLYDSLQVKYENGLIHRVEESAYVPEFQRYGGVEVLPICEKLFHLNSIIVSDFINTTSTYPNKDKLRWQMCLRLAWKLTVSALDSLEEVEEFFKSSAKYFDFDMNASNANKKKIHENYRVSMNDVAEALSPKFKTTENSYVNDVVYPEYNNAVLEYKKLCNIKKLRTKKILNSLIHMDCNRMFVINPRANEWIIFHYLSKYSRTVIARNFTLGKEVSSGYAVKV